MFVLAGALLCLGGCSQAAENSPPEATSKATQMTLAEACVEVSALGKEQPIEQADYAPLRDRAADLVKSSQPEARAVLTRLRDAYQQAVDSAGTDSMLEARRAELAAFESLDSACEAVGSPLG
jgi:hypothetical protein